MCIKLPDKSINIDLPIRHFGATTTRIITANGAFSIILAVVFQHFALALAKWLRILDIFCAFLLAAPLELQPLLNILALRGAQRSLLVVQACLDLHHYRALRNEGQETLPVAGFGLHINERLVFEVESPAGVAIAAHSPRRLLGLPLVLERQQREEQAAIFRGSDVQAPQANVGVEGDEQPEIAALLLVQSPEHVVVHPAV